MEAQILYNNEKQVQVNFKMGMEDTCKFESNMPFPSGIKKLNH